MSLPTAWITGAGGLIGTYFLRTAAQCAPEFQVVGLTRAELDLTDLGAVRERFQEDRPQLVIHCAALSKSAACEKEPVLARKLNVEVTEYLAKLAEDIPFVFFSTDLAFDGQKGHYGE